ncbi:MAG TPA: TIGR02302 family protein [Pseudorhodoplanes sp.]|nr:TIGR02302 family protein [Pseudorhodoplanes sp.]
MAEIRTDQPIRRALGRARLALFWERAWPPVAAGLTVTGAFLVVSWLGLWLALPPVFRIAGLCIFAALMAGALYPLLFVRFPGEPEGLSRLDRGLVHRPATAIADELAVSSNDPVSLALWRAHVERALKAARGLRAGWPSPRLVLRDPYALRGLVAMLAIATFFAAGGERGRRILAAFDWQGAISNQNYRIDAWVTPPAYTGRPPVILPGLHPGEPPRGAASFVVPAGSVLVIRSTGAPNMEVAAKGGLADDPAETPAPPAGTRERRFLINEAGDATLRGIGSDVTWSFQVIPDRAPTIALSKDPEPQARGALQLQYKIEDDYGVVDAQATFERKDTASASGKPARPLFGAPNFPLILPQARTRNGSAQTTKDLTEHPWAGVDVTLTLTARDEAGNEGRSEPFDMRLPQRPFGKPLARALIEQRRILALDAEAKPQVLTALDALTIAPEKFTPEAGIYLGLRSIFFQLKRAKTDDELRDVVGRLWAMAVQIEDGNVSDAEAALRQAQDRLRDALERGASDEEIKKLTDELRAALDKFMQALLEQMQKNPQNTARIDPNARNLRPQDLKSMIDRLENLARSGARDAARRLLEELNSILENLQMARPGQQMDGEQDDMMSALDELGDMIRRQQQLRDRTFRQGQDGRRERQRAQRNGQGNQGERQNFGELRQDQQALREQLRKLLDELKRKGMGQQGDPDQMQQGENGEGDQLGRAGEAMGDAEGALGEGNADDAVDAQGRALEALRKGAQGMAQSMQQQMGQGPGGPGQPGRNAQGRAQQDTDPLGRPLRGRDYGDDVTVKVPGEIDVQRARRILEELRRRFADPNRPQIELDYLQRLLRDF